LKRTNTPANLVEVEEAEDDLTGATFGLLTPTV
jgi:hypothetical protein